MFNKDFLTLQNLTASVNKTPFLETTLSRFFQVGRIATTTAMVERGASGLQLIDPSPRYQPAPDATDAGLARTQYTISSVKLGRTVTISGEKIQNIRAFGTEDALETFEGVLNQETGSVRNWIAHTHENLRWGTVKGKQYAANGTTVLTNFFTLAGVTEPDEVEIDFVNASRADLQNAFADMGDYVRTGLGVNADAAQNVAYLYGKNAWRKFRNADPVAALYDRYQDGAVNRAGVGGQRIPFEIFGAVHMPYFGASIGDDEFRAVPVGVPGLFRTEFTPLDNPETANTLGLPLYASADNALLNKGYIVELASLPIHYVTQPECLIGGRHVDTP